jgi:hypothetical protein
MDGDSTQAISALFRILPERRDRAGVQPEDFEDNALKEDFPAMVRNFRAYVLERINGKSADPLT